MTQRILSGVSAALSVTFADQHGEPAAAEGAVTVDITRADGTVVATGTTADTGDETGVYLAAVDATVTATLDLLTCVWNDGGTPRATTQVEVVGGYYFSIADARASDPSVNDQSRYPDDTMRDARAAVEVECETITGVAWVPRFAVETVTVPAWTDRVPLRWPEVRTIRSAVSLTGGTRTSLDVASFEGTSSGQLVAPGELPAGDLEVTYEHGHDTPPPDLRDATLLRLRSRLNMRASALADRATSFVHQGGGTTILAQPGRAGFETGIPEVDFTYKKHSRRIPGIA